MNMQTSIVGSTHIQGTLKELVDASTTLLAVFDEFNARSKFTFLNDKLYVTITVKVNSDNINDVITTFNNFNFRLRKVIRL